VSRASLGSDPRSFDRFASDYDRYTALERPALPRWLADLLPPHGRRALDAGCGSGRSTLALAERFDEVVGVDISLPLIEIARASRPHPRVRYLLEDLMHVVDEEGFDLVYSSTVLHHLDDLDAGLRHLRELVAPGGTAVLIDNIAVVPTPSRWVYRLGALRFVPLDVRRHGWGKARWLFGFRTSGPWLDHLASDRYLSRRSFEHRYGAVFPDPRFRSLRFAHALIWRKPRRVGL
jgi:SAM-dependent methyltransferase